MTRVLCFAILLLSATIGCSDDLGTPSKVPAFTNELELDADDRNCSCPRRLLTPCAASACATAKIPALGR